MTLLVSAFLVSTLTAPALPSNAAMCLAPLDPWRSGEVASLALTATGRSAVDAHKSSEPFEAAVRIRVLPERADRPAFVTRLRGETTQPTDLGVGEYSAELVALTFKWPDYGTMIAPIAACPMLRFTVSSAQAAWAPTPQVFLQTLGRQPDLGMELYGRKWGLAGLVGLVSAGPASAGIGTRVEARFKATRGSFGVGLRSEFRGDETQTGLAGSFALELPPFKRRPLWIVGELDIWEWTGSRRAWLWSPLRAVALRNAAVGIRIDARPVRR